MITMVILMMKVERLYVNQVKDNNWASSQLGPSSEMRITLEIIITTFVKQRKYLLDV